MATLKTMKFDYTLVIFLPLNSYRDIRLDGEFDRLDK